MCQQGFRHAPDGRRRDRQADTPYQRRCVDSRKGTIRADQRPAGKTGIHDDIGLHEGVDHAAAGRAPAFIDCADDAERRLRLRAGTPNGQDQMPNFERLMP